MRTTDATRDAGSIGSGLVRGDADSGGEPLPTAVNQPPGELPARKPLALCSQAELVERARNGHRRAREKILAECRPAILSEVEPQHTWLKGIGLWCWWDLYQEAVVAVFEALQNYQTDRARGKFKCYADYYIKTRVRVAAARLARPESLSTHLIQEMSLQVNTENLQASYAGAGAADNESVGDGRPESSSVGNSVQHRRVSTARQRPRPYSLDFLIYDDYNDHFSHPSALKDQIADTTESVPGEDDGARDEAAIVELISAQALHRAVASLDKQERIAVVGRYGLGTESAVSVSELAKRLGVTRSMVKDMLVRARATLSVQLAMRFVEIPFEADLDDDLDDGIHHNQLSEIA